jgi:hypothetical protein
MLSRILMAVILGDATPNILKMQENISNFMAPWCLRESACGNIPAPTRHGAEVLAQPQFDSIRAASMKRCQD